MESDSENKAFEPSLRCKAWAAGATVGSVSSVFAVFTAPAVLPVTMAFSLGAGLTALRVMLREEKQFKNRHRNEPS